MADPYKVLGVSRNASDDEIKKAYRELSRKYHPDSYVNNPLADLASEKFKEVQEAYNQIMNDRQNGYSGGYSSGTSSNDYTETDGRLVAVANYINARQYQQALNALDQISDRNARWYYFSAIANMGIGNNVTAQEHAKQAVDMDPGNREYSQFYQQIQWGAGRYQQNPYRGGGSNYGMGNLCCDLWCADTLCECMGGDLCSCF